MQSCNFCRLKYESKAQTHKHLSVKDSAYTLCKVANVLRLALTVQWLNSWSARMNSKHNDRYQHPVNHQCHTREELICHPTTSHMRKHHKKLSLKNNRNSDCQSQLTNGQGKLTGRPESSKNKHTKNTSNRKIVHENDPFEASYFNKNCRPN